jgi:hypothetical protein
MTPFGVPSDSFRHIYYTSLLRSPSFEPGVESLEVRLFPWEEVPWAELAFPTVSCEWMHRG